MFPVGKKLDEDGCRANHGHRTTLGDKDWMLSSSARLIFSGALSTKMSPTGQSHWVLTGEGDNRLRGIADRRWGVVPGLKSVWGTLQRDDFLWFYGKAPTSGIFGTLARKLTPTRESEVLAANHKSPGAAYLRSRFQTRNSFRSREGPGELCRANSPGVTKDLCKVLLGLEATGNGHVQYSRMGSTQQRFSTLKPLVQNKLMRSLAR